VMRMTIGGKHHERIDDNVSSCEERNSLFG